MSYDLCITEGGNVGGIGCDKKRATPLCFVVGEKEFTPADRTDEITFVAAIKSALNLNEGTPGKLYPFPVIGEVAETTEAPTRGSLTLGTPRELRKGKYGYDFSMEVGHSQFQALYQWHGRKVRLITLDSLYNGWFEVNEESGNVKGEQALVEVSGNGFEDGNSAQTGVCHVVITFLDTEAFIKRSGYYSFTSLIPTDLQGLKDVLMSEPQAHVSSAHKVQLKMKNAKLNTDGNIYDQHGAAIAALTFTAGTGTAYGTALTITSVAVDAALKAFTVTFDNTAYTALPNGTKIKLTPPTVATLAAAGITGIEIAPIILTK
jgi:hypothetical protein